MAFNTKALYSFTVVVIIFLLIFLPIRISQGQMGIIIVNLTTLLLMIIVNVLLLFNKEKVGFTLFITIVIVMMIAAILSAGSSLISWLYPASALIFFTTTSKRALIITSLLSAVIGVLIFKELNLSVWMQHILSIQLTIFIVYIFCTKVSFQIKKLEISSGIDKLSGLLNRRSFDFDINQIKKSQNDFSSDIYILLFDIDDFKLINDTYGHNVGDEIIKHTASTIKNNSRNEEKIYRIGGEEFAVIFQAKEDKQALYIANRQRERIELTSFYCQKSNKEIQYTTSVGVAKYNGDAKEWFINADEMLYKAKRNGKNRVEI